MSRPQTQADIVKQFISPIQQDGEVTEEVRFMGLKELFHKPPKSVQTKIDVVRVPQLKSTGYINIVDAAAALTPKSASHSWKTVVLRDAGRSPIGSHADEAGT